MGRGRAPRANWQNIAKENQDWEEYYRKLNLPTSDPADFARFKAACQTELPVTFRITGTSKDVMEVREIMQAKHINKLNEVTEWEGKPVEAPRPLSFYPDNLAWQVNVGKQVIRRNPLFSEFQRFLVVETNAGNISRQELVSMIPPLFLEVEPHHVVLDTCASPGSKTTQLIEALHHSPDGKPTVPSGLVIANDSDYKRSHMLTHQVKRLNSPNIIVTNHDAQMYPKIWLGDGYLKFDRILCDVPCTGDATMRKNINVWKDWKVSNGQGLHQLQLNIASRSVHLMRPDGQSRLVYSTCSLNPTEDEAVVAQLLRQFPHLRLADVSSKLPTLKRMPGISDWDVQERKTKAWFKLSDHYDESSNASKMPRSWFAPSDEEKEKFHLERCVRVYPDQQNSGGFFIAAFELDGPAVEVKDLEARAKAAEKKAEIQEKADSEEKPAAEEKTDSEEKLAAEEKLETPGSESEVKENSEEPASKTAEESSDLKRKAESELEKPAKAPKLPRDVPASEEPFKFLRPDHPELLSCRAFYGLKPEFKMDTLVVRNAQAEPSRTIYFVAPSLKAVLENNDQKLKVIHAGIKLFNAQRNDGECKWRVQIEGINMINEYATKRVVTTSDQSTLKDLCLESFIRFDPMAKIDRAVHDQVIAVSEGCCLWRLNGSVYPLWRGKASVNLMAPKENTEELLLRLFDIDKKKLASEAPVTKEGEKEDEKEDK